MNGLSDNFYRMPRYATATATRKELRAILLETGGEIFACGELWSIKSKHLGAGVYKLFLEKKP